jgi:3-hydroxy acid dehydrogenase/malonic semialdehyde reductase
MAQRLKGKTIVITGASSGIGKSTALEFAKTQPEIKLILTARREDTLKEVAKEIEGLAKGVKVLPVKLDVSNIEEVQSFVEKLPQEFKDIDVLVNNAYGFLFPPPSIRSHKQIPDSRTLSVFCSSNSYVKCVVA